MSMPKPLIIELRQVFSFNEIPFHFDGMILQQVEKASDENISLIIIHPTPAHLSDLSYKSTFLCSKEDYEALASTYAPTTQEAVREWHKPRLVNPEIMTLPTKAMAAFRMTWLLRHSYVEPHYAHPTWQDAASYFADYPEDAESLFLLGRSYGSDLLNQKNPLDLLHKAAKLDHPEALYQLYIYYASGIYEYEDGALACHPLKAAADLGHALAQHDLAEEYKDGSNLNPESWWELMQQSANNGCSLAQIKVGYVYETGDKRLNVAVDIERAHDWYRRAAMSGNRADFNLTSGFYKRQDRKPLSLFWDRRYHANKPTVTLEYEDQKEIVTQCNRMEAIRRMHPELDDLQAYTVLNSGEFGPFLVHDIAKQFPKALQQLIGEYCSEPHFAISVCSIFCDLAKQHAGFLQQENEIYLDTKKELALFVAAIKKHLDDWIWHSHQKRAENIVTLCSNLQTITLADLRTIVFLLHFQVHNSNPANREITPTVAELSDMSEHWKGSTGATPVNRCWKRFDNKEQDGFIQICKDFLPKFAGLLQRAAAIQIAIDQSFHMETPPMPQVEEHKPEDWSQSQETPQDGGSSCSIC
jgi:TPR repeat protein